MIAQHFEQKKRAVWLAIDRADRMLALSKQKVRKHIIDAEGDDDNKKEIYDG
jgi:hypothetical protein